MTISELSAVAASTLDAEIAVRRWSGEVGAVEEAYREHGRACYSAAMNVLHDAFWAEDVTQEVFVDLWQRPHRYEASRGTLRTWLMTVAHHKAVDRVRWLRTRPNTTGQVDAIEGPSSQPGPADASIGKDRARRVTAALGMLPAADREMLVLAYFGGLSQTEIAVRLGYPLGTVKSRCRRAMHRLRAPLSDLRIAV